MFHGPITIDDAGSVAVDDHLAPVRSMLDLLQGFAGAWPDHAALRNDISAVPAKSLAARYATANSITRRRFDAILRETETAGTMGLRLIVARGGRSDHATIAAARFLGNSIGNAVRRLENLLPPQAI